jgi:AraC-like DNA-binding protein
LSQHIDGMSERLRQGQSVTDACNNAGFGDYSYFIADFRRFNGITPAEYAKQHRHEE